MASWDIRISLAIILFLPNKPLVRSPNPSTFTQWSSGLIGRFRYDRCLLLILLTIACHCANIIIYI